MPLHADCSHVDVRNQRILGICLKTDALARKIYDSLAEQFSDTELSAFWRRMAEAEGEHVRFWEAVSELNRESCLPLLFEDPDKVIEELSQTLAKISDLSLSLAPGQEVNRAFLLAYRLEFYLLHPAFEVLFNYAKDLEYLSGALTPENDYDKHISDFIEALRRFGAVTEEMELVGDTLLRLWNENKRLAKLSNTDFLTQLLNRRGFFAAIQPFHHLAARNRKRVAVMILDLDHFKTVNDTLGHAKGDEVLVAVAELLREQFRKSDIPGRFGGEEFIVFMYDVAAEDLAMIGEKIRAKIEHSSPGGARCTASLGIASAIPALASEKELQSLIVQADNALYQAKNSGRNRVVTAEDYAG